MCNKLTITLLIPPHHINNRRDTQIDVGRLIARIEDEVVRKKGSVEIVQIFGFEPS